MEVSLDAIGVGYWLHVLALHHVKEDGDGGTSELCTSQNKLAHKKAVISGHKSAFILHSTYIVIKQELTVSVLQKIMNKSSGMAV